MNFKRSGEGAVEIFLSKGELSALDIDRENIDCDNPLTQKILLRLLQRAAQETGLPFDEGEFVMELYGDGDGAVLRLTKTETQNALPQVYCFGSSEAMIQVSCRLCREFGRRVGKSWLYNLDGCYYLTIAPGKEDGSAIKGVLLEYGCKAKRDSLAAGALCEHARCLIEETAVQTISRYFDSRFTPAE